VAIIIQIPQLVKLPRLGVDGAVVAFVTNVYVACVRVCVC